MKLLDDALTAPQGSLARKVADFRAAYLNDAAIEAKGIQPLAPLLDSITLLRDKAGLARHLGRGVVPTSTRSTGACIARHTCSASRSSRASGARGHHVAFLLQGGLGLPDRDPYLSPEPGMAPLRARYRDSTSPACWHWPDSDMQPSGPGRSWRWKRRSRGARPALRHRPRTATPTACGTARRLRAPGAGHGLVRLLRRGGSGEAGSRSWCGSPTRHGLGGPGCVPAAHHLEGLSPLSPAPRPRRRAAARLRRGRRGAATWQAGGEGKPPEPAPSARSRRPSRQ